MRKIKEIEQDIEKYQKIKQEVSSKIELLWEELINKRIRKDEKNTLVTKSK